MCRQRGARERGTASVEFGVALPLLMSILLGVWDFGRLIDAEQLMTNAAREGARQASTGQCTPAQVQQAVSNYLARGGINATGLTVQVSNVTSPGITDPSAANRMDQLKVVITLPSNNVRLVILSGLRGANTLQASATWCSMRDSPITLPPGIPDK